MHWRLDDFFALIMERSLPIAIQSDQHIAYAPLALREAFAVPLSYLTRLDLLRMASSCATKVPEVGNA